MVFVSNGLNTWAMQYMPSNQSALLNGTSAFWIAGLGVFGRRGHPLTRSAVLGLVIGFIGAVLMLIPKGPLSSKGLLAQMAVLDRLRFVVAGHAVLPQHRYAIELDACSWRCKCSWAD